MSNNRSSYHREYYKAHKDKIREQQSEYYEAHQDKIKAQKREYRDTHSETIKEAHKKYREENKETIAARKAEYRRMNPDKVLEEEKKRRERHEANPEIRKQANMKYREEVKNDPEKSQRIADSKKEWAKRNAEKVKASRKKYNDKKKAEKAEQEAARKQKLQATNTAEPVNELNAAAVTEGGSLNNVTFPIEAVMLDDIEIPELPFDIIPEIYNTPVSFGFYAGTSSSNQDLMPSNTNAAKEAEPKKQKMG